MPIVIPVPETYKTIPVDEVLKFHMRSIQRYLKCVAIPLGGGMFIASFICERSRLPHASFTGVGGLRTEAASPPQTSITTPSQRQSTCAAITTTQAVTTALSRTQRKSLAATSTTSLPATTALIRTKPQRDTTGTKTTQ